MRLAADKGFKYTFQLFEMFKHQSNICIHLVNTHSNMGDTLNFKWTRPNSEYPRVWNTFMAKDIDSDELVEYRIQDSPESREDEAVQFMAERMCKEEPLSEAFGNHFFRAKVNETVSN